MDKMTDEEIMQGKEYEAAGDIKVRLLDLMIEFDEMGFSPTIPCEDFEEAAVKWRDEVIKEISALESENAALRERLERAVELPCKLGAEIYAIQCEKIHTYYAAEICVMEGGGFEYIAPTAEEEHLLFGRDVFTTREAAEARLKELQGGEGNGVD